jgi:hypothetical protein
MRGPNLNAQIESYSDSEMAPQAFEKAGLRLDFEAPSIAEKTAEERPATGRMSAMCQAAMFRSLWKNPRTRANNTPYLRIDNPRGSWFSKIPPALLRAAAGSSSMLRRSLKTTTKTWPSLKGWTNG